MPMTIQFGDVTTASFQELTFEVGTLIALYLLRQKAPPQK